VTSGYPDWVQGNEPFQKLLFENPFRQFTSNELLHWAFTLPIPCKPGTCFYYAHTNFAILSQVIAQVTGESVSKLIRERVLGPLGLDHTQVSRDPAMPGEALPPTPANAASTRTTPSGACPGRSATAP
jgi:CubicO group peptidase (beta-lactamase class C family)